MFISIISNWYDNSWSILTAPIRACDVLFVLLKASGVSTPISDITSIFDKYCSFSFTDLYTFPIKSYADFDSSPLGWSWSPIEHLHPWASILKHSNSNAAWFFKEWKSPQ